MYETRGLVDKNFAVAVLAFKAVYYLENTRQENDRRVMTLYVKMKDMMMVMVQCVLRNFR